MVFIYTNAVEAQLFGVFKFIQIAVVEFMPFFRGELCVGISYPTGVVFLVVVWIDIGIRHEVKEKNFHV